jgi:uncharacterized protein (DUF2225 family)
VMADSVTASRVFRQAFHCPVCGTDFRDFVAASGTQFGMRSDFMPIGHIAAPPPLAVCPTCHFVLFKGVASDYAPEDIEKLKELVASDAYSKLPIEAPSYQRLALIRERLKNPLGEIAFTWLQASWQVASTNELCNSLLRKSADAYDQFFKIARKEGEEFDMAMLIRGELYRRLRQFDEAESWFKTPECLASEGRICAGFIAQQLRWIAIKDSQPPQLQMGR